jgi:hypothetical protein
MNTSLHKKVKTISLTFLGISILGFGFGFSFGIVSANEGILIFSTMVFALSLVSLSTKYSIQYYETAALKKIARLWWISLILLIPSVALINYTIEFGSLISLAISVLPLILLLIIIILRLFIFMPGSFTGILFAMALLLIGIFMKQMHWFGAGIILTMNSAIMACGMFASGLASLFWIQKNNFLRVVSFIGSSMLTLAFCAFMFKFQHWPMAGVLLYLSEVPIMILTIVFLIMLPNSGFFDWSKMEKRIFGRILIPWVFFLILISLVYLFPNGSSILFAKEKPSPTTFKMYFYTPENKNGLLPE